VIARGMMAGIGMLLVGALVGCGGIGDAQKHVRTAVDAKQPTLNECYATTLSHDASARGQMQLTLHVAEKGGRVDGVQIKQSDLADQELQSCIKTALVGLEIAPAPKANLDIEYTMTFTPEAPPAVTQGT
jgi:hypothetical protein